MCGNYNENCNKEEMLLNYLLIIYWILKKLIRNYVCVMWVCFVLNMWLCVVVRSGEII